MTHKIQSGILRENIDKIISNFKEMSSDDLNGLITCDNATIDSQFVDPRIQREMGVDKSKLMTKCQQLAEENMKKETDFFDLRNKLLMLYQEGKDLKKEIEEMQETAKPGISADAPSLDSLQGIMEAAAREAEDESESIASDFLDSSKSVEAFISEFMDSRTKSHLRRIRCEKAEELIRERSRLVPSQGMPQPVGPNILPYPSMAPQPSSMPYPSYAPPYGMPPRPPYPAYPGMPMAYPPPPGQGPMSMPTPSFS